jgi:serine/threonine-protein kinase
VITELAQLKSLIVRPSSVIAKYQGREVDPREAGQELRVHAVLSAGFIRSGDKMRVTAQLLDVLSGDILWSDRTDAESGDILILQDTIAQQILDGLRLELSDGEQQRLGRRPTENAEAYEEYLRGRDNFGRFIFRTLAVADCDAAIHNFKHAIELDPHFALAHSGLGACYANRFFQGLGEPGRLHLRRSRVFQSVFLRPERNGSARFDGDDLYGARRKTKSASEIESLQKQFPNDAPLYFVKGVMHRLDGEYDESLRSFEKLVRPRSGGARRRGLQPLAHLFVSRRLRKSARRARQRR